MDTVNDDHLKTLLNIDWTKVKHFYYIAKLGSFTKAARFLNATQPGLSRQIKLLETELNCTLFYRGVRGVILTRKGEELFKVVEKYFFDLKSFNFNHITMNENGQKRKIRISTTQAIAAYVLNEQLLKYNRLHPDIVFEVIAEDTEIDMAINDIDIMIRPYNPNLQGIEQAPLFTLEKKLYASLAYLKQYGEPQAVEDLQGHHMIAMANPEKHIYSDIHWILRLGMPAGTKRDATYISNSFECLVEAAQEGWGIISSYDEMKIIRQSGLKRILPNLVGSKNEFYIHIQHYLSDDKQIINLKKHLIGAFKK